MSAWSFGFPTDGISNIQYHPTIINSIIKQSISNYEIIFITENKNYHISSVFDLSGLSNVIKMLYIDSEKPHHITKKKNDFAKIAQYDNLFINHDYIILDDNWYDTINNFKENWNVLSCKIKNKDGSRTADWIINDHPIKGGIFVVDYDFPVSKYNYINGMSFIMKKSFLLEVPFDEHACWGGGEDIEWSQRANSKWNYYLLPNTYVHCLKMKNIFEKTPACLNTPFLEMTKKYNCIRHPNCSLFPNC